MSTTIAPTTGQGMVACQQGAGTTPGFSAIDARRLFSTGLQEGVDAATDWMVVQRGAGANMSVDITTATGYARVQGDSVTAQGLYMVAPHSATINETLTTADVSNPRVDQVILEILDNVHDASGSNLARTRVVAGTPTGGATLANRSGAAALPSNACRLADVLVGTGVTSVDNTKIRDRRPWARGAYYRITRTSSDYTTTTTGTAAVMDGTNLNPRIECTGNPMRSTLIGETFNSAAANVNVFELRVDTAQVDGGQEYFQYAATSAVVVEGISVPWDTVPAAGSHQFAPYWKVNAGTGTFRASAAKPLEFIVEEIVRANTANNLTTSG